MYVEIHSKSDVYDDSAGKRMWVNSDKIEMSVSSSSPKHLNSPPWHLELKTKNFIEHSSGERGGDYIAVIRSLEMHLTPADLTELLSFALANGLLSVAITARDTLSP